MLKGVIPIQQIKKWVSDEELQKFCEHVVDYRERYEPERVFEAKSILDNLRKGSKPNDR